MEGVAMSIVSTVYRKKVGEGFEFSYSVYCKKETCWIFWFTGLKYNFIKLRKRTCVFSYMVKCQSQIYVTTFGGEIVLDVTYHMKQKITISFTPV